MSTRPQARTHQPHSAEIRQVYERLLAGTSVRSRHVEVAGDRVHLLEQGAGPPVVLLHGTGNPAGFLLPLLHELHGVRAIAPDVTTRMIAYLDALPPDTRSSLLIDLEQGKRIEVEALQGAAVRRAQKHGVPVPILSTLYALLKPWENGPIK